MDTLHEQPVLEAAPPHSPSPPARFTPEVAGARPDTPPVIPTPVAPPAVEPAPRARTLLRRLVGALPDIGIWLALFLLAAQQFHADATARYSFDAIAYATQVETYLEGGPIRGVLHPHHLLFDLWIAAFWKAAGSVVRLERALEAQQLQNALLGALGVAWVYLLGRRVLHGRLLPLGLALIAGSLFGYRFIAADGGIYAAALAPAVVAVWAAVGVVRRPTGARCVLLGAVAGVAALLHQMHVLLGLMMVAAPLLATLPPRRRVQLAGLVLGVYSLVVGIPYLGAALQVGCVTPADFLAWFTEYGRDGRWWSWDWQHNLRMSEYALVHVFLPDQEANSVLGYWRGHLTLAVLAAGVAGGLVTAAVRAGGWRRRRWYVLFALWIVPYVAMFTVWVPGYYAYWVPITLGALLMAAVALETLVPRGPEALWTVSDWEVPVYPWSLAGRLALFAGAVWLVVTLWRCNTPVLEAYRDPEGNPHLSHARQIERNTRRGDLILMAGTGAMAAGETYIPYFAERQVITLDRFLKQSRSDGKLAADLKLAMAALRVNTRSVWRRGHNVYALSEVFFPGTPVWPPLQQRYSVKQEEIIAGMRKFQRTPVFQARGKPVFRLRPPLKPRPEDAATDPWELLMEETFGPAPVLRGEAGSAVEAGALPDAAAEPTAAAPGVREAPPEKRVPRRRRYRRRGPRSARPAEGRR